MPSLKRRKQTAIFLPRPHHHNYNKPRLTLVPRLTSVPIAMHMYVIINHDGGLCE